MLRITQQDSAKDAKRYYASADYYSQGQGIVGLWGGEGAHRLGLDGTVTSLLSTLCNSHSAAVADWSRRGGCPVSR